MKVNEVIELKANEGLEIDFSRLVFVASGEDSSRPSWIQAHLSAREIEENATIQREGDYIRFTEDDLEVYLKRWLEYHFNCGISSFRWMWDKYRNFKQA